VYVCMCVCVCVCVRVCACVRVRARARACAHVLHHAQILIFIIKPTASLRALPQICIASKVNSCPFSSGLFRSILKEAEVIARTTMDAESSRSARMAATAASLAKQLEVS